MPEDEPDYATRARLLEHEVVRLRALVPTSKRNPKLLILDLNGLLLYRRMGNDKSRAPRPHDKKAGAFNVWLRPHATTFLDFVLSKFHVAIWSSAGRHNILPLLNLLFPDGDGEQKVAFVWSQSECTDSGETHPDNPNRPLFLKEVSKVFERAEYEGLYTASNTLLIDDDAYKAARNPHNTCISPAAYEGAAAEEDCSEENHGGLHPRAEIRRWLGRLALADSVPGFVASQPVRGRSNHLSMTLLTHTTHTALILQGEGCVCLCVVVFVCGSGRRRWRPP
jgi:hypothetical protein